MYNNLVRFAAISFALHFPFTFATAEKIPDNAIVITATRTAKSIDDTMASVIVIGREEIRASQASDVADILRFHAGLEIGRNGGPGQLASIFIRGSDSNHTLVLVDGVKINPGTIGGAPLNNIDPEQIERIEIVKGPRSSLYGSEAIGGVIHIFTRKGQAGSKGYFAVAGGTNNTQKISAGTRHKTAKWQFGFNLSHYTTDGFPARIGGPTDTGHEKESVNLFADTRLAASKLRFSHWQAEGTTEYHDFFLSPLDQDFLNSATSVSIKTPLKPNWVSTLKVGHIRDKIDQNQNNDFAHTRRNSLDWQNDFQLGRHNLLTAGLYLSREQTVALSFGTSFDTQTRVNAAYVQNQWHKGRRKLTAALRHTDHETFGNHHTGELSFGYQTKSKKQLWVSAATGFRAPDSTDRFGFGGNNSLRPETSRNLEAGVRFHLPPRQQLTLTAFQNEIDDLILFVDPDGFLGPIPGKNENIEKARIRGIELDYQYRHKPWHFGVKTVIQDPRNRTTGKQLARRAKRSFSLTSSYQRGSWKHGMSLLKTSERPDSDFTDTLNPGYTLVNLYSEKRLSRRWRLQARIENAGNRKYVLADSFNSQGRAYFLQLQYNHRK